MFLHIFNASMEFLAFLKFIFIFLLITLTTITSGLVEQSKHEAAAPSQNGVPNIDLESVDWSKVKKLDKLLKKFKINIEDDNLLTELKKIKTSKKDDGGYKAKSKKNIKLLNFLTLGQPWTGKITASNEGSLLIKTNKAMNSDLKGFKFNARKITMEFGSASNDINMKGEMIEGVDINILLPKIGFKSKNSYRNTVGMSPEVKGDDCDVFIEFYIRISPGNNWHLALVCDNGVFVCTHLGVDEDKKKLCGYARQISDLGVFKNLVKSISGDKIDLTKLNIEPNPIPIPFDFGDSSIQSAKETVEYSDPLFSKKFGYFSFKEKKTKSLISTDLVGGENSCIVKLKMKLGKTCCYGLKSDNYKEIFWVGKLTPDSLTVTISPNVKMDKGTIAGLVTNPNLVGALLNNLNGQLYLENIVLSSDKKICVTMKPVAEMKIDENFVDYSFNNSILRFCELNNKLSYKTVKGEEKNFGAKMFMNIDKDENDNLRVSGDVMIVDSPALFDGFESNTFLPNIDLYKTTFKHLLNFPVFNLYHRHVRDQKYISFDCQVLLNGILFNTQFVYKSDNEKGKVAMCLDYDVDNNSKRRQDLVSVDDVGDDTKSISMLNFTQDMLQRKNLDFNPVARFRSLQVSLQSHPRFYTEELKADLSLKCGAIQHEARRVKDWKDSMNTINPHIYLRATKAEYECKDGSEGEKKICKFLQTSLTELKEKTVSEVVFYGYLTPEAFKMQATFQSKKGEQKKYLKLMRKFKLKRVVQTIGWSKEEGEEFQGNEFRGKIGIDSTFHTSIEILATLKIMQDSAYFSCPVQEASAVKIDLLGIPNVISTNIESPQQLFDYYNNPELVFRGSVILGRPPSLTIGGGDTIVEQYVENIPRNNKFVACMSPGQKTKLTSIFGIFGLTLNRQIFDTMMLSHVCFAHSPVKKWKIKSADIEVNKGLRMYARTVMAAPSKLGVEKNFDVKVEMTLSGDDKKIILEKPALYFYPMERRDDLTTQAEPNVNQEAQYKVKIMKDKKSPKGPDLEIQYDDNQNYKAFLTGYIYTNAFQGPVKLSVDTNDFETVTFVRKNDEGEENENNIATRQLEDDEDKKESTVLNKGFEVRGSIQPGRKNMQFRFTGDGVIDAVQTNYTIFLTKQKEYFEKRKNNHTDWKKKVDEKLQEPVSKASKRDELEHMYNEIQGLKHEFRKQQYYKQQSCDQCNAVMSPGFIWDSCRVNDRLGKISCLQFKKDALVASNTQCLANCGIARSIGDENAKVLQHGINKKTAQLSKRSKETAIYDQLKSDVQEHQNAFNYAANLFKDAYMEFEKLDNDIKVQSISTDWLDFDDFEKATALEFTIKFDDDSVDKCNFIVDGGLYGNIAKFILNKYHENTITETDKKEKDVQTKYGVALQKIADWFVINRDFITKVKRGQVISPEARSRKRSGIPSPNKRVYDSMKVLASPSSLFYEDPMSTNMLLTNHAPWNALRRSNPFFARNGTVNQAKRHKTSKSASYCKNRRNKIRDYKDMVNYMKSWSDSFIDARNFIPKSKVKIATGLKSMEQQIMQKRSLDDSVSSKRHDISSKWINRLKAGFSNWEKEFSQQVASYYSYGPNMMLNEMNAIFTPAEFESLQAYIQSTPSNALSRSLMQDQSLYHIGQNFTTGLSSMRTLDDSRNLVNRMQYLISEAEKSSPRCHDEL